MSGLEIGFLIAGLLCFVASFFISEKLSSSDLQEIKKMSDKEITVIIEKELQSAEGKIVNIIDAKLDDAIENMDIRTDRLTNEKIMAIEEYSTPVLKSIDESHKQVMFMYNMLVEKQNKVTELTADVQKAESNLRMIKQDIKETIPEEKLKETEEKIKTDEQKTETTPEKPKRGRKKKTDKVEAIAEALEKEISKGGDNQNEKIVQMYKEGASEVEIAKTLGKGLGEIKLVLGLFHEGY